MERSYLFGAVVIAALAILLIAQVLLWIGVLLGIVLLAVVGWRVSGLLLERRHVWRLANADARKQEAEAALAEEQVETARVRRHLIPGEYIGAQLRQADQYRIWGHGQVKVAEVEEPALSAPALPRAEPFAAIAHQIAPGRLILGYNSAGAIPGDMSDLLSTAIVGRPGTGKTTALRFVCAQVLRVGGRPVLLDPHGSIADEVSDVLECAEDGKQMQQLAAMLETELDRRLIARREKQSMSAPLLLIADEWPVISKLAPQAVEVAGRIVLEGRKVGMYALISGQGLPSEQLGGSLVRDALSSRYVFNTTTLQARMAGIDNDTAKTLLAQLETAGPGYAILASARRNPEIIAIPQTTIEDMRALVEDWPILPPLPMKKVSLSVQEPPKPAKTPAEAERERILATFAEHPTWSNARVFQALGFRNNNKLSLIAALRKEAPNAAS